MSNNEITGSVVDSALKVHFVLGPGLLETVYETCLSHELRKRGHAVQNQVPVPVVYDDICIEIGYRIDLLVNCAVIVEIKSVSKLLPVHDAQLLSYLKLSKHRVGLLINFNVVHLKDGIRRLINGF
jgi:GxxExxY protein